MRSCSPRGTTLELDGSVLRGFLWLHVSEVLACSHVGVKRFCSVVGKVDGGILENKNNNAFYLEVPCRTPKDTFESIKLILEKKNMVSDEWGWLDSQTRMSGRSRRGHVKEVSEIRGGGETVEGFVGE